MSCHIILSLGRISFDWKNSPPAEIALLFLGKHRIHRPADVDCDGEDDSTAFVGIETTALQARRSLDSLGLTRAFFETLYDEYRPGYVDLLTSGYLAGYRASVLLHSSDQGTESDRELRLVDRAVRLLRTGSASGDFDAAVEWLRRPCRPLLLNPYRQDPILPVFTDHDAIFSDDDRVIPASVLGEFLQEGERDLPEIANLLKVRLILEAMEPKKRVRLDLGGFVREGGNFDALIPSSVEDLAWKATLYQRTFDAITGGNETIRVETARHRIADSFRDLRSTDVSRYEKGRRLERFLEDVVEASIGLEVASKAVRTEDEELDLILKNNVPGTFWSSLNSPFIYVECKNWASAVGTSEARVFESKMRQGGPYSRLGLFVALNGTTKPFRDHLAAIRRDGICVAVITGEDFDRLLRLPDVGVIKWLENVITAQFSG